MFNEIKKAFDLLSDVANYFLSFSLIFVIVLYILSVFFFGIWGLFWVISSSLEFGFKFLIFSIAFVFFLLAGWVIWKQIQIKNNEEENIKEIEY
ncbi:MAG: hypothetical protein FI687_05350 [SAR202 cluster bacterium]|nr:hypothetical protein [SAR202 cluster bacterium]|tara:strand:- start:5717 stop:5998 length:282 start_codon:yes stop_codon:yes gene_type:complete